jgi:hypothetical protein
MGASIRARLTGLGRSEVPPAELDDTELESALGRLSAYDGDGSRRERRRRVDASPPLHGRSGLWRR